MCIGFEDSRHWTNNIFLTLKAISYLTAEYKYPLKSVEVDQKAMLVQTKERFGMLSTRATLPILTCRAIRIREAGNVSGSIDWSYSVIVSRQWVRLLVGGATVSSAAPYQVLSQFCVEITRVVKVAEKIALTVEFSGSHYLNAYCVLEFAP
ncbi:hypothetical protein AC1031_007915 [Aphanomyces cochlioides]|nr:hypothetical protein AC1031_007910 [Aphanomyces cochlioides]KAG9414508.1 hypothetical protein AC1031_007915 [Aphanomyces cochlioides]